MKAMKLSGLEVIYSLIVLLMSTSAPAAGYDVVISKKTAGDQAWRQVADTLVDKYKGRLLVYEQAPGELLPELKKDFPKYVCYVQQPTDISREFVRGVHMLARQLDDDPYADCLWGILTGYDAANAMRIAKCSEPLTIRKVSSGTPVELKMCEEGVWYSELKPCEMVRKEKGGEPKLMKGAQDTTEALVKSLTEYKADLFVTSGHATERDWQIGYTYRNGQFRCDKGEVYGLATNGSRYPVQSPNAKVYMPIGNCLMGHIDGSNAMAIAYMNSCGVNQMLGYIVPTWYGYAGWGCIDYFIEQPGRYTFTEAFFANHAALIHRIMNLEGNVSEKDLKGLMFDRDNVAFYGDPAWEARMADMDKAWEQKLSGKDGLYTFEITPRWGTTTFMPVNTNGSQRGRRPIVQFLPYRVKNAEVLEGKELKPVITDDFILVPNPETFESGRNYVVKFKADKI